jgi:hypothetical protein
LAALAALRLTAGRCSSLVAGASAWRSARARAAAAANRRLRIIIMVMLPLVAAVMLPQTRDGRTGRAAFLRVVNAAYSSAFVQHALRVVKTSELWFGLLVNESEIKLTLTSTTLPKIRAKSCKDTKETRAG